MKMITWMKYLHLYTMLSSLSDSNKKWLADHLYADIERNQDVRTKEQMVVDMEHALLEAKAFKEGRVTLKSADCLLNEL